MHQMSSTHASNEKHTCINWQVSLSVGAYLERSANGSSDLERNIDRFDDLLGAELEHVQFGVEPGIESVGCNAEHVFEAGDERGRLAAVSEQAAGREIRPLLDLLSPNLFDVEQLNGSRVADA